MSEKKGYRENEPLVGATGCARKIEERFILYLYRRFYVYNTLNTTSKYHRYIEELLVSPIQNYTILAGFITGGVIRGLAVGVVVILAAQFFVNFTVHSILLMLIVILLSSTLFSMCGFLNGLFANDWDDINVIPTFIMTPLTYLGGIFFSISMLPEVWQDIALVNPILYLINALRYSMLGITDVSIIFAFFIILIFNIFIFALCMYFLSIGKGLRT